MTEYNPSAPDADVEQRPGHPKEHQPQAVASAHWLQPEQQSTAGLEILREPSREKLTATFGTEHQPAGLSGALRRKAYQVPDHRVSRWALLILADRVATLEVELSPRKPRNVLALVAGVAAAAGYFFFRKPRSRLSVLSALVASYEPSIKRSLRSLSSSHRALSKRSVRKIYA